MRGPHPFGIDDITTFYLEDCLGVDPGMGWPASSPAD